MLWLNSEASLGLGATGGLGPRVEGQGLDIRVEHRYSQMALSLVEKFGIAAKNLCTLSDVIHRGI